MRHLTLVVSFLLVTFTAIGQNKAMDVITMLSGDQKSGNIINLDETNVYFQNEGDTATMVILRSDVNKVVYANGKTQIFNTGKTSPKVATTPEERKGKIAILPFEIKNKDFEGFDPEMSITVQNDCIELFEKMASGYEIQKGDSTLVRLRRGGVTVGNVTDILPADMARMLGVEFVAYGSVWVADNAENKGDNEYFKSKTATTEDPQAARSDAGLTEKKFETIVDLNVYTDLGEVAFTKVQQSFWAVSDAYKVNLETIISLSPFVPKPKKTE
jgi:hypothetical protein